MDNSTYLANAHRANRNEWKSADAGTSGAKKSPIKMIYMTHNLKGNYRSADGSGDADMKTDILMSEIAKLIVHQPDAVGALLNKHGIAVGAKPSNKQLINQVTEGLHRSQQFASDMAGLIVSGGMKMSASGRTYNAPGDTTEVKKDIDYAALIGNSAELVKGLGSTFGGKKKAKANAAATKAEIERLNAEAELEKAKAKNALKGAVKGVSGGKDMGDNIGLYIAIAVGVASLTGIGIWWFKFRKK